MGLEPLAGEVAAVNVYCRLEHVASGAEIDALIREWDFSDDDEERQEQPYPQPDPRWDRVLQELERCYQHWAYRRWFRLWQAIRDLMRAYDVWSD